MPNVIVTGAAGGIGCASITALLERPNVNVTAVDRLPEAALRNALPVTPDNPRLFTVSADAADSADVERYVSQSVERWGSLDGILCLAGVGGERALIADASDSEFDRIMHGNALTAWLAMKHIVPHLLTNGGGSIVTTGSYLAEHGSPRLATYAASKYAVIGMTKSVAIAYARENIRVNAVSPGGTDTGMFQGYYASQPEGAAAAERNLLSHIPAGRLNHPDEPARTAIWALLDAPPTLTGHVFVVDGGQSAT